MSYDYRNDIRLINDLVQNDLAAFTHMLRFVLATIQQQLETVPDIAEDFERNGTTSTYAFGSKRAGLEYLEGFAHTLYEDALGVCGDPEQLLRVFLRVPGFGIVKAGFAAQLFSNQVGCIDRHNVEVYGVPLSTLRYPKTASPTTQQEHIERYCDLCRGLGGSTRLWAAWCHYVHTLRPGNWRNGGEVSYFHYAVISGSYDTGEAAFFLDLDYQPLFIQGPHVEGL